MREIIDSSNADPVDALRELTNGAMVDRVNGENHIKILASPHLM